MTNSGVISKVVNKDELVELVRGFCSTHSSFFTYKESVTKLSLMEGLDDQELKEPFQLLKLFSEKEEWVIRPQHGQYLLVIVGEELSEDDVLPLTVYEERSIYLDQNVVGKWKQLEIVQYQSENDGYFSRWKGVRVS